MIGYNITDADGLDPAGPKTKARANLEAIRTLKELESTGGSATPEQQRLLVRYSGWGGLPQMFEDPPKPEWQVLADQLQVLLSPGEYEAARTSTLNAHYTSEPVVRAIWDGVEYLGFGGGRILDPSMGTGRFAGLMPESLQGKTEWSGIELDPLTAGIARQLYPRMEVHNRGFERTSLPDDHFDLAISNVPFSEVAPYDPRYVIEGIQSLHDYFFVKGLDKVRPGGLVVFLTSIGTLQSTRGEQVRELLSSKANLVGAMRLPGDAFKATAGTEVTTDLVILQKLGGGVTPSHERWMELAEVGFYDEQGKALLTNEYYARHPEQMLGELADDKLHPGRLALTGDGRDLSAAIRGAFARMPDQIYRPLQILNLPQNGRRPIPVDLQEKVKADAFVEYAGLLYRRDGDYLVPAALEGKKQERVMDMLAIRDALRQVFYVQTHGGSDEQLRQAQHRLTSVYDQFILHNGYLNDAVNRRLFAADPDAPLLLALEKFDAPTAQVLKSDVFTKRTIAAYRPKTSAASAAEALLYSLNEKSRVDLPFMARLCARDETAIVSELKGVIFQVPGVEVGQSTWQTADDYLSGNVRKKLAVARISAEGNPAYLPNVAALEAVQPVDLLPGEIDARLGSPWIEKRDIAAFTAELLGVRPVQIHVAHVSLVATWSISAPRWVEELTTNTTEYGTARVGALELIEKALNLKDPAVYDFVDNQRVLNPVETEGARLKQQQIKDRFKNWLWQDLDRAERLAQKYNRLYNSTRLREYDGTHLELPGSNPEIQLRPHQKAAVWRILQEGKALLDHEVGLGKTFTMVAAAMESRRLGLAHKPMIVVPNHMLEQMSTEFRQLYPNAQLLAVTKDDFSAKKRQFLMSRIATGNWDAVIVTHSGFERLPMSREYQKEFLVDQVERVKASIIEQSDSRPAVKELEKHKKRLEAKIAKVSESLSKDQVVGFEELGVDQIYIDEAHAFKNLGYATKMYAVRGLPNTESQRAFDMFMKTQYLLKKHEDRGVVFATGTPVTNSMAEMFTMSRFLQTQDLIDANVDHFDAWAANFGETVTAPEIGPTGTYRVNTRFSRFVNLPELINLYRTVADVRSAESVGLGRPQIRGGKAEVVIAPSSPEQLEYLASLALRAQKVRGGTDPRIDNMLKITNDGRLAALDLRLVNPGVASNPDSKIERAVRNVFRDWQQTAEKRSTQLVFCDLSTPKADGHGFSVYNYLRQRLIENGVPAKEIAFIHDHDSDVQKAALFAAVRNGDVRILLGSTQKMGAGTNVQKKLISLHHLDAPWRPADIEQREGRIIRQGNENSEVRIYRYITEGAKQQAGFDSYLWQTLETKQRFISQIRTGNLGVRSAEDCDSAALTFAEVKALATGNPLIIEKAKIDNELTRYSRLYTAYSNQQYSIGRELRYLPQRIENNEQSIGQIRCDIARTEDTRGDNFKIAITGQVVTERRKAGEKLNGIFARLVRRDDKESHLIGEFAGFPLRIRFDGFGDGRLSLTGEQSYTSEIQGTALGTVSALENAVRSMPERLAGEEVRRERSQQRLEELQKQHGIPFEFAGKLEELTARQAAINSELELDKDNAIASGPEEESENQAVDEAGEVVEGGIQVPIEEAAASQQSPVLVQEPATVEIEATSEPGKVERGPVNEEAKLAPDLSDVRPAPELVGTEAGLEPSPAEVAAVPVEVESAPEPTQTDTIEALLDKAEVASGQVGAASIKPGEVVPVEREETVPVEHKSAPTQRRITPPATGKAVASTVPVSEPQVPNAGVPVKAAPISLSVDVEDRSASAAVSSNQIELQVSRNAERNGIELRFSAKPEPEVIASLKGEGFRYSAKQNLWWAKQTPERTAFVEFLQSAGGSGLSLKAPAETSAEIVAPIPEGETVQSGISRVNQEVLPGLPHSLSAVPVEVLPVLPDSFPATPVDTSLPVVPVEASGQISPVGLDQLREWYRAATHLGKPKFYLNSIVDVGEAFKAGKPVPEMTEQRLRSDIGRSNAMTESVRAIASFVLSKFELCEVHNGEHLFQGTYYSIRGMPDKFNVMRAGQLILSVDGENAQSKVSIKDLQAFESLQRRLERVHQHTDVLRKAEYAHG